MFIWSKLICGTLVSGLMLRCSIGMKVKERDFVDAVRDEVMMVVISDIVSTGVPSIAIMMLLRSVDRQRGMRAAGVDATHHCRVMRSLAVSCTRSRPRVG